MKELPMQLPFGAVYFRKSNPPREDWERDYRQAAVDGHNLFRHWFMWGCIETAPGVYDWEDYDRQLELGEKYGVKTIIAEITTCVPEWVFTRYPEAIAESKTGAKAKSQMGVSSAVGGFYDGVCLDTQKGRELIGGFLKTLAARYKGHPALLGYDVWNECNYPHDLCYCAETKAAYRRWLEQKYGGIHALGQAWYRYSLTGWEDVQPPDRLALYPESFDWLEFRKQTAYAHMRWKLDILRGEDPNALMTAHGTAQSLGNMALGGSDEWMAAAPVDLYGYTFVASRQGAESFRHFSAADLTRSGARGKPFWHAETQGGPLWLQPQTTGRAREDGRITEPEDIRLWNLTSLATGARGLLNPRWRPLLDGPLFGAFGAYGMDGLPTPNSAMYSSVAKWSNAPAQKPLLAASPVPGDLGIIILPEAQSATLLLSSFGSPDDYRACLMGVHRAFYDRNIQADFVHIDDIDRYRRLYLPIPLMLTKSHAAKLSRWVAEGGQLFSEGCPGYFGDRGKVETTQPGLRLHELFGVTQQYVEFTPDLIAETSFSLEGRRILGGEYWQTYLAAGAEPLARDDEGRLLAASHSFGKGRAVLVGTCPSLGYWNRPDDIQRWFFAMAAETLGVVQSAVSTNAAVKVRIQMRDGGGPVYLWALNTSRVKQRAAISLSPAYARQSAGTIFWNPDGFVSYSAPKLEVNLGGRDGMIIELK